MEKATLAGGCFWCTEAIFQRLKGVESAVPGYSGGHKENPTYEEVCSGNTGHAETIQIAFDPKIIPYEKLLEIFFALHDPTTLNKQGADIGTQYRSAIFYHSLEQKNTAEKIRAQIAPNYENPIVTEIVPFKNFYKAENYHENYFDSNRMQPYCQLVIDPKIKKLLEHYKEDVKEEFKKA